MSSPTPILGGAAGIAYTRDQEFAWRRWNAAISTLGAKLVTDVLTRADYPGSDDGWDTLVDADRRIRALQAGGRPDRAPEEPALNFGPTTRIPPWARRSILHVELEMTPAAIRAGDWLAAWHSTDPPRKGLFINGPVGVGKTSIAAAIAHDTDPAAYWPIQELLHAAREAVIAHNNGFLRHLQQRRLLVLDDLGRERLLDFQADVIRELIEARYDRGVLLVVTTNLTNMQLTDHVGERCHSRLAEMCEPLPIVGEDRRRPTGATA